MLKNIIIFLCGGVICSIPTYLITSKKKQAFAEEQISQMEEYYNNRLKELENKEEFFEEIKPPESYIVQKEEEVKKNEDNNVKEKALNRGKQEIQKIDYTQYYGDAVSEEEHDFDNCKIRNDEIKNGKDPYVINEHDFGSIPGSDIVSLIYYKNDGTFVYDTYDFDDGDIVDLDEVRSMLGDVVNESGFADNDEETIYIRNDRRNTDYEITKAFTSYEDN